MEAAVCEGLGRSPSRANRVEAVWGKFAVDSPLEETVRSEPVSECRSEVDPDSSHSDGILELKNAIPGRNLGQTDRVRRGSPLRRRVESCRFAVIRSLNAGEFTVYKKGAVYPDLDRPVHQPQPRLAQQVTREKGIGPNLPWRALPRTGRL